MNISECASEIPKIWLNSCLQALADQRNDWLQTYGNDSTHLKSDYAELLEADYLSDGKTLNATFWLASSNLENASAYNQPFKKISYGMLIDIASTTINAGYNGADYYFYVEAVNGKWSQYLYQLSSTGAYILIDSDKLFRTFWWSYNRARIC
jgi:hypothetical protein